MRYSAASQKPVLGWVLGRWNENWEPVDYKEGALDLRIMLKNRRLDRLYPTARQSEVPSSPYEVAFAIKEDGREDFCHFNDVSYEPQYQPGWRNPAWVMGKGIYTVEIRVRGYGLIRSARASFTLSNEGTSAAHFRLAPST